MVETVGHLSGDGWTEHGHRAPLATAWSEWGWCGRCFATEGKPCGDLRSNGRQNATKPHQGRQRASTYRKKGRIERTTVADENNVVNTVVGGNGGYRRTPCPGCPWVVENDGSFPAEAFRISAHTSYDLATAQFACHESQNRLAPQTCAGFLLRNSANNVGTRLAISHGKLDMRRVREDDRELHDSYREMAIANGVAPDDPVLVECRGDNE